MPELESDNLSDPNRKYIKELRKINVIPEESETSFSEETDLFNVIEISESMVVGDDDFRETVKE